ncbi:TPA: hypothetical protein ACH3X2_008431 [Trebouxia sp. C0005]
MTVRPRPVPRKMPSSWSAWDRAVSVKLFHASSRTIPRKYMILLEYSGNGLVWLFAALATWCLPSITPQQRCAITNFLVAFVVDLILVGSLKSLIRRPRPIYNSSGDFILVVSVDRFSFPSGHASRAFYVAAFACVYFFHWSYLVCILATVWGVVTALSRAAMGRHYVGDICAGMPLGILTVAITTKGCFSLDSMLVDAQQAQRLYEIFHACFAWFRLSNGLIHLG